MSGRHMPITVFFGFDVEQLAHALTRHRGVTGEVRDVRQGNVPDLEVRVRLGWRHRVDLGLGITRCAERRPHPPRDHERHGRRRRCGRLRLLTVRPEHACEEAGELDGARFNRCRRAGEMLPRHREVPAIGVQLDRAFFAAASNGGLPAQQDVHARAARAALCVGIDGRDDGLSPGCDRASLRIATVVEIHAD